MMSVLEYAEDVNKTVSEILNLCRKLNIPATSEDDELTDEDITAFISHHKLDEVSPYDICRGHDVLKYLSLALVKLEYSVSSITSKMINAYSRQDFQNTHLYADISEWQMKNNVSVV